MVHDGLTGRLTIKNGLRNTVNMAIIRLDYSGKKIEQLEKAKKCKFFAESICYYYKIHTLYCTNNEMLTVV